MWILGILCTYGMSASTKARRNRNLTAISYISRQTQKAHRKDSLALVFNLKTHCPMNKQRTQTTDRNLWKIGRPQRLRKFTLHGLLFWHKIIGKFLFAFTSNQGVETIDSFNWILTHKMCSSAIRSAHAPSAPEFNPFSSSNWCSLFDRNSKYMKLCFVPTHGKIVKTQGPNQFPNRN